MIYSSSSEIEIPLKSLKFRPGRFHSRKTRVNGMDDNMNWLRHNA